MNSINDGDSEYTDFNERLLSLLTIKVDELIFSCESE